MNEIQDPPLARVPGAPIKTRKPVPPLQRAVVNAASETAISVSTLAEMIDVFVDDLTRTEQFRLLAEVGEIGRKASRLSRWVLKLTEGRRGKR